MVRSAVGFWREVELLVGRSRRFSETLIERRRLHTTYGMQTSLGAAVRIEGGQGRMSITLAGGQQVGVI